MKNSRWFTLAGITFISIAACSSAYSSPYIGNRGAVTFTAGGGFLHPSDKSLLIL